MDDRDAWGVREQLRYLIEKVDKLASREDLSELERRHAAEMARMSVVHKTDIDTLHSRINSLKDDAEKQRAETLKLQADYRRENSRQRLALATAFVTTTGGIIASRLMGG